MSVAESREIKQMVGKAFLEIADAIESGQFGQKVRVGLTTLGSEHGVDNLVQGAKLAAQEADNFDIVLIGPQVANAAELETVPVDTETEMHQKMEELLESGYLQACVTMHYNFPIGVATVGKVVTPGQGREMLLATTTGTASPHRVEAMVKNALYGIITAKAMGIENPTLGILNLDGARQVEKALKELNANGYPINFSESVRSDGGAVMRGNDLLTGTVDVMVTDTLTGNIMMKVFSSYTTGGSYEAIGYGYGPGVGEGFDKNILILSRASGVPVIANALKYAAKLAQGKLDTVAEQEFAKAREAKLSEILQGLTKDNKQAQQDRQEAVAPEKEVVTGTLVGVDIMELEDAVSSLWQAGIYAESGMGCTGPIIMVNEEKISRAKDVLCQAGYLPKEAAPC